MKFQIDTLQVKKRRLIEPCTLETPDGEMTVIRGKNGTGKTLLLNLLYHMSIREGYSACLMSQASAMLPGKQGLLENIALSTDPEELKKAEELLDFHQLSHLKEHGPDELSGGERRLISLLRCLYRKPAVLFLDEPTNDLDYHAVNRLQKILTSLKGSCTIIAVSHDDRMFAIAGKIYLLENACLKEDFRETQNVPASSGEDAAAENEPLIRQDIGKKKKKFPLFLSGRMPGAEKPVLAAEKRKCLCRALRSPAVLIILAVIFSAAILYFSRDYGISRQGTSEITRIAENEVDFVAPISTEGVSVVSQGALHVSMLALFNEEMTDTQKIKLYEETIKQIELMELTYGMNIEEDDRWLKFELEYYLPGTQEFIKTLDVYTEENALDEEPDTTAYFYGYNSDWSFSEDAEELDLEKFARTEENLNAELEGLDYSCTFFAVSLMDISFYDFIQTDTVQNLIGGNYYIRSAETEELVRQIVSLKYIRSLTTSTAVSALIFLLLNLVLLLLMNMANTRTLRIYRNCGMLDKALKRAAKNYTECRKVNVICAILTLAAVLYVLYASGQHTLVTSYVGVLFYLIALLLASVMRRVMTARAAAKAADWRYRG